MTEYKLTPEQADALLDRLANDAGYRALFQQDVAAAFAKLPGAPKPPPDLEPGCCLMPKALASPEKIQASRDALRKNLTSLVEHLPHLLEQ